tara:strand:+ start:538 stop:1548 length:1011 start_codon:yes stop_codon:yes gene_type:complete
MVLPTGESPVSFSQIRNEFGTVGTDSATAPVRLGQYRRDDASFTNKNVGELSNLPLDTGIPTSGSINIDAFHGKKLNTVIDLHESGSSTFNHNVKTDRFDAGQYDFVGGYRDSLSPATWQGGKKLIVHINNTFGSNGASNVNDVALTIGSGWPADTEFQIDLGSSAVVAGKGGNGGNGGAGSDSGSSGTNGTNGTSALALETGMSINSQASGAQLFGGGGGGGGGGGASQDDSFLGSGDFDEAGGGGGGGGRGLPAGDPGSGGSGGGAGGGSEGSVSAGGNGGSGGDDDESEGKDGGAGGGASSAGVDGGTTGSNGRNVDGSNGEGGSAGSAIIFF